MKRLAEEPVWGYECRDCGEVFGASEAVDGACPVCGSTNIDSVELAARPSVAELRRRLAAKMNRK